MKFAFYFGRKIVIFFWKFMRFVSFFLRLRA